MSPTSGIQIIDRLYLRQAHGMLRRPVTGKDGHGPEFDDLGQALLGVSISRVSSGGGNDR